MTGAGNDFILVDARESVMTTDWTRFAPRLCHRRYGIGADGLLILERSVKADFGMKYFNADGSFGGMCGNGGRCAALYVMLEGKKGEISFETLDYVYRAAVTGDQVKLDMKDPSGFYHKEIEVSGYHIPFHFIDTGTAHAVIFLDELDAEVQLKLFTEGIKPLGAAIRHHEQFAPDGTNVDFIRVSGNTVSMRTYERGVENETLACGTGAVASAVTASLAKRLNPPIFVSTKSDEMLLVNFVSESDKISHVQLSGSARFVFSGECDIDQLTHG